MTIARLNPATTLTACALALAAWATSSAQTTEPTNPQYNQYNSQLLQNKESPPGLPSGSERPVQETIPAPSPIPDALASESIPPLSLQAALEWTLSANPDLVAQRQNLQVSNDALAVARQFPTSLNPTVSLTVQPWVFERAPNQSIDQLATLYSVSWQQPIEFGHRTEYRTQIAHAAFSQTRWNVLQAELLAMVQTYRFHQAAVYRYQKYRVAAKLAEFNERLLQAQHRQLQANQASAADVVLAEVENQSTRQRVETTRQEYVAAIAELCQQIGAPQYVNSVAVAGDLQTPDLPRTDVEDALVKSALECRPEIRAARAQASGSHAAISLARADRIPIPSVGPVIEKDETNVSFYGLGVSSPIPVLNAGARLVRQRESEHHRDLVALEQTQQKIATQVKTAMIRCQEARRFSEQTNALTAPLADQTARMERLYDAGQSDLVKLYQVRQRLIDAENVRLDAGWQAIQAYADLLAAVGATPLAAAFPASE